ncbi:hypothetical protein, partial [Methylorubrum extorquens]|uniref:hypothetical protein n=1 Tax=Methylorubrum extorquens TaxID=408 RepID=UPI001AEDF53E
TGFTRAPNSIGRYEKGRRCAPALFSCMLWASGAGDGHGALRGALIGGTAYSSLAATTGTGLLPGEPNLSGETAG